MPAPAVIFSLVVGLALLGLAVTFALFAAVVAAPFVVIGWLFSRRNPLGADAKLLALCITLGVAVIFYFIVNPVLDRVDIQHVQMNALMMDSKDIKARGVCS